MVNHGQNSSFLLQRWNENGISKQVELLSSITQIGSETCSILLDKYESIAGIFRISLAEHSKELCEEDLRKLSCFY